jgi:cell division septum initiation protein DivIVA
MAGSFWRQFLHALRRDTPAFQPTAVEAQQLRAKVTELETQVARVEALTATWRRQATACANEAMYAQRGVYLACARALRRALDGDDA